MAEKQGNPFVSLGASLGGILLAIVAVIVIFAKDQAWVLAVIAICFVILGGILARGISRSEDESHVRVPLKTKK